MFLAIDYGLANCGIAISEGEISEPYSTVPTGSVVQFVKNLSPELIVIGISEGTMAEKTREFADSLRRLTGISVETTDETLSSHEADTITADKDKQHAVAAALILQRYLDNRPEKN